MVWRGLVWFGVVKVLRGREVVVSTLVKEERTIAGVTTRAWEPLGGSSRPKDISVC